MTDSYSNFNALEEHPYLNYSPGDTLLEKEFDDYDSLVGLRSVSSKLLKDSPIAAALAMGYLNSFMGGKIYFDVNAPNYIKTPMTKILRNQFNGLDINRDMDLNLALEYVIYGAFKHGDKLVHAFYDKNFINESTGLSTNIELIDASRIVTPFDLQNDPLVRNGVKYQNNGLIEGYFVLPTKAIYEDLWNLNHLDFEFVPVRQKIKIGGSYYNKRVSLMFKSALFDEASSARGMPALIPASKYVRYIDKDIKAIVIGMYTAACFAGFVTSNNPAGAKEGFDATKPKIANIGKISPGSLYFLRKGETVTFGSPQRPADNTDSFIQKCLMMASASIRSPYELSFLHLANTSFSSWKGGANEIMANRARWLNRMNRLANFIAYSLSFEALVNGQVRSLENVNFSFRFPKFDPLDREKVARASRMDLQSEITTKKEEIEDRNMDYEEVQAQQLQEELDAVERHAKVLSRKMELESEYDILFQDESPSINKVNSNRRPGEPEELTEDDKLERRKEDGNM